MAVAALAIRSASLQRPTSVTTAAATAAHGHRTATAARRHRAPCSRLRALPPELSEILNPKLVPGSPSDTGDVSSLIPVSALMLLLYLVTNWVVPELVLKRLQNKAKGEADASAAASLSLSGDAADGQMDGDASRRKIRLKVKKKKNNRKASINV